MRLLVINPIWPHSSHSSRAANIVLFELLRAFAREPGIQLGFLKLSDADAPAIAPVEREALDDLRALGVQILPECRLRAPAQRIAGWRQLLAPTPEQFYPALRDRDLAMRSAEAFAPDALVIPWSEMATALFADMPVRKYAYYGNPDHKSLVARTMFERRYGGGLKNYLINRILGHHLERLHLGVMRKYEAIGDVASNDALYYRRQGIARAEYIQNVWLDRFPDAPPALANGRAGGNSPARIIANVGKLGGTANTYGLAYLAEEVLPHLPAAMNGRPYEVHILGAGALHPHVARVLPSLPGVVMRGFVDDIDEEMAQAGLFLCVNNGTAYNVGHTRYLHAWSLGCCVIAHAAASEAMPEIRHEENALLGRDGAAIAGLIARAAEDADLRHTLGRNGYDTFRRCFMAGPVAARIVAALAN